MQNTVNIEIGSNMYSRFEDFPNTMSNVLAEFIDNALQSYRDNKEDLHATSAAYQFGVDIIFTLDNNEEKIEKITVRDNAAGINEDRYKSAFMPAKRPENTLGLNEYGMGLKTAACWLGDRWTVVTKALGEDIERTLDFDKQKVAHEDLKSLPITTRTKQLGDHYTFIAISQPTKNMLSAKCIPQLKSNLASIYRQSLRSGEMRLVVDDETLEYHTPEPLVARPVKNPNGDKVEWKKDINFEFLGYKAKGFIGVLKDINNKHNGLVLLRRGRVVQGAEEGQRYYPKALCGSSGTFRYKRIYGELELDGFNVSFNKNEIQDIENLEALMEALKGEVRTKDFDLLAQADDYRLDTLQKAANRLVKKHNTAAKIAHEPISIEFPTSETSTTQPEVPTPQVMNSYDDTYLINGESFTLTVKLVGDGNNLFWVDISEEKEKIISCYINLGHAFFVQFGQQNKDSIVAILKTMAIAKFRAKRTSDNDASDMLQFFNDYIRHTKT